MSSSLKNPSKRICLARIVSCLDRIVSCLGKIVSCLDRNVSWHWTGIVPVFGQEYFLLLDWNFSCQWVEIPAFEQDVFCI